MDKNNITIEDLRLVYDRDNREFVKAFVTIDGVQQILVDDREIRKIMKKMVDERGVNDIEEIPHAYSLAFSNNEKAVASFERKYSNAVVLKKASPFDHKRTTGINKGKIKRWVARVGIMIGLTSVSAVTLNGCNNDTLAKETAIVQEVQDKQNEKVNPESWSQYVDEYVESMQKKFLTGKMDDITSNIVDITVNDKEYKLALSPEELIALNYYYNTFKMTNEDMLSTYGLYNLDSGNNGDLVNNVHNGLNKIKISLAKAEKPEDVLEFKLDDEECQKLWDKYVDLILEYNTSNSQSNVKSKIEDEFRNDYMNNGSIDINEHPSATVILQVIPHVFDLKNDSLNSNLYKYLLGVENNNADGKTTIQQNGLVDTSCSVIEERLEKFDDYRQTIQNDHRIDSRLNRDLLLDVNKDLSDDLDQAYYDERYVESDFSKLTKNTYDLKTVMIPLMNTYLMENYELSDVVNFEEINDELMKEVISELQEKQLNNTKPWSLTDNPSGGQKGDVLVGETQKSVTVTESQLINGNVTQEQITEAKEEYLEKNPDVLESEEDVSSKQEEDTQDAITAWNAGRDETMNVGESAPLNSKYANHKDPIIVNAYYDGRNAGIAYYNDLQSKKEENKTPVVDPSLGEDVGDHKDNPNQNGTNDTYVEDVPVTEDVVTQSGNETTQETIQSSTPEQVPSQPEVNQPVVDTNLGEMGGEHNQNPNQSGGNTSTDNIVIENVDSSNTIYNIDTSDVIEGTITTDSTGVEDMSQYGDVQDESIILHSNNNNNTETVNVEQQSVEVQDDSVVSYSISSDEMVQYIDSLVEELANPSNPINVEVETQVDEQNLTK